MMLFAEMEEPRAKPQRKKREPKPEPVRRPMTDAERKVAMALELLIAKRQLRPAKKHGLGPA